MKLLVRQAGGAQALTVGSQKEFLQLWNNGVIAPDDLVQRGEQWVRADQLPWIRGMTAERVHELARGRVWTGADALAHGLVDELGGLDLATSLARARAGLPATCPVRGFPDKGPRDVISMRLIAVSLAHFLLTRRPSASTAGLTTGLASWRMDITFCGSIVRTLRL